MEFLYSLLGEFFGTALLVIFGNGSVACALLKFSKGNKNQNWVLVSIGWTFAIYVAVLTALAIGGTSYINPAIAIRDVIGFIYANDTSYVGGLKALISIPISIFGAMFGQFILYFIYLDAYKKEENHALVLASHSTGPAIKNYKNNFITEFLATIIFAGGIYVIGYFLNKNLQIVGNFSGEIKRPIDSLAIQSLPVSLLVLVGGISLGGPTGYAINPARDLGPRVVHQLLFKRDSNWEYSWVPIIGPLSGGALIGIVSLIITIINR